MVKAVVSGALGRMGTRLVVLIKLDPETECIGGIDKTRGIFNEIEVFDNPKNIISLADVVIDFSSPEFTPVLARQCQECGKALVSGTTGIPAAGIAVMKECAEDIPILYTPNMSLGVNLLFYLTEITTQILKDDFDIEIMEIHHHHKKDAPSGTAKRLGEIISRVKNQDYEKTVITGRNGNIGERTKEELGILAFRGGNVVGEHNVMYFGSTERLELVHKATSRDTFVYGAIKAAKYIAGRDPGWYSMADVLGLSIKQ
ncbi:MAG TPA: 4-hydroxy-tetrahydrodipicolinate reductase [Firmicutes bacterium]|nr:4-hydroxy-tetrahydrodipicolinate reductase [Bacillota bacterium]